MKKPVTMQQVRFSLDGKKYIGTAVEVGMTHTRVSFTAPDNKTKSVTMSNKKLKNI